LSEAAVVFDGARLVGILSEPERRDPSRPCVVLLNAGVVPRTGPGRLTVLLARTLADAGFGVFRLDLSGLGDSEPRLPPLPVAESVVADVRAALDNLGGAASSFRTFVVGGLCAGAVSAHYAAVADERVVGVLSLDGFSVPTLRWRLARVVDRLREPRGIVRSVLRRKHYLRARVVPPPVTVDPEDAFLPRWPGPARAEAELGELVRRKVQMLYLFSGEWEKYRYEGQIRDAFPRLEFGTLLTERRIPHAEHLYFTFPERLQMLELVTAWLGQRFPASDASRG
jgi:pimeloyl-ACP methyl ester carboxylesterase